MAPLNPKFTAYLERQKTDAVAAAQSAGDGEEAPHALGNIPSSIDMSHLALSPAKADLKAQATLPSSYDLRALGKVSPVKDQKSCDDCWAFTSLASLESTMLSANAGSLIFSENHLNTQTSALGAKYPSGRAICDGGNAKISTSYMARWDGPLLASQDPNPTSCTSTSSCYKTSPTGLSPAMHLQNMIMLPARTGALDNDALKSAVSAYGGVYISISADMLAGETKPYWNSNTNAYYYNGAKVCSGSICPVDHAVTLVGWDDNYAKSNFLLTPAGNGAFLLKNSWGSDWGDGGYFWISYYDTALATDSSFVFLNPETPLNYTTQYEYDPYGWAGSLRFSSATPTTGWMANVFTAAKSGSITAIATYTGANNSTYTVQVYQDVNGSPSTGALVSSAATSGTIPYAGYHPLLLRRPFQLQRGASSLLSSSSPRPTSISQFRFTTP